MSQAAQSHAPQNPAGDHIVQRVERFIDDPGAEEFSSLAADAFRFQFEHSAPYRRLCDSRGVTPGSVADWRDVPAVPTAAYKSLDLSLDLGLDLGSDAESDADGAPTFRSSGTRGGEEERSVHRQPFPGLYRHTLDAAFPHFCPLATARPAILALVPQREDAPDSSLAFMVDHLVQRFGGEGTAYAFGRRGADARTARSWIGARQRDGRPALLLATAFALADLLDGLEKMGLRFRLPAGSAALVTGGYKGQRREVDDATLAARLGEYLGLGPAAILGEYGMTELTSQLYTGNLRQATANPGAGSAGLFHAPHWVRARVLDPNTLEEAADGADGLIAIFDLANLGSAVHVLTEDLGRMEPAGDGGGTALRLLGRAPGAELRGCSLAVEELTG